MLPFIKKYFLFSQIKHFLFFLAIIIGSLFLVPTQTFAQSTPANAPGVTQLEALLVRLIALTSGIAVMALIIMFVYAGIRFITSNGEAKNIQAAQQVVTWAVIGAGCLVLAWIILLIISQYFALNLTRICLSFDQCS